MNDEHAHLNYYIDTEEIDKEVEIQRILLQRQYKKRKQYQLEKEKKLNNVKFIQNNNELKKIEEKAKYNSRIYLPDKYLNCYKSEIINNDSLGKCSLHFVLGGLLRYKKIYKSPYTWLDYRVHLILFQMSGTGKGMTANFIDRLLKKIKFPAFDSTLKLLLPREKWKNVSIIASGKATPESLINDYIKEKGDLKRDKKGKPIIKKGSLQIKDYFIYEEGGKLFNNSKEAYDMTDHFLKAMEPIGSSNNIIEKDLASFETSLTTTSDSSIFIMTRPIGKIKQSVAQSGFFQRCLFIPKEIPYSEINDMRIKSSINDLNYMGGVYSEENYDYYNDLIDEFIKVIEFSYNNDIQLHPKKLEQIKSFFTNKMAWFYNDMIGNVMDNNFKDILCSLENRYKDNMFKLAYHSACMRYSKYVDEEDFQYAFDIMKELYREQKNWLYDTVETNYMDKKELIEFQKMLVSILKLDKNGLKNLETITIELCKKFKMDKIVCKKKLIDLSEGTLAIIKIDDINNDNSKIRLI